MRGCLEKVPGVTEVDVDFAKKTATVTATGIDGPTLAGFVNGVDGGRFKASVK